MKKILTVTVIVFLVLLMGAMGGSDFNSQGSGSNNEYASISIGNSNTKINDGNQLLLGRLSALPYWNTITKESVEMGIYFNAGGDHWCTNFIHWRFYKQYGSDCGNGNGVDIARNTAQIYGFKLVTIRSANEIEKLNEIKAGSIISYKYATSVYGHVGFIEGIQDGYITHSDGNSYQDATATSSFYNEGLRLNYKQSIQEFINATFNAQGAFKVTEIQIASPN